MSSEQNERTEEPQMKRKISDSNYGHQCHKNHRGRVVQCNQCKKRYCIPCIIRW
ncbi:hypothetical protein ACJIZ3_023633 [Penstemon smallii]|uniref:RING-type domain-containing protein n=1 Tax=Penstemon smallii TaxID=265156 RepID=A0ABD3TPL9_9LAMI